MATAERAPRSRACAPCCLSIKRRIADHGGEQSRRAAKMIKSKLHKRRIGLSFGDLIPAGNRVDQVVHIHQAAIVFQFIGLTIGGERDASSTCLDGSEGLA